MFGKIVLTVLGLIAAAGIIVSLEAIIVRWLLSMTGLPYYPTFGEAFWFCLLADFLGTIAVGIVSILSSRS